MSVSNGHLRYKKFIKQEDGTYKLVSHWTSAETVEYDNDASNLEATTTQEAIDELNEKIGIVASEKADATHNHDDKYDSLGSAEEALDSAKSYVDNKVSDIPNTYETKTDANSKLDTAKAYTDSAIANEVTVRDSAIDAAKNSAIDTAASDATTKANNALASAKEYTDTAVSEKADANHNHDEDYDVKGSADTALSSAKSYTDTKTADLASTSTVDSKISTHNTSTSAHNDIREMITSLTNRLNALADSDDTTLDQMSELVEYIKDNRELIEGVTTTKVNVSDIVNNLTTNSADKVLSAAQGVAIKGLIDALQTEVDNHTHAIADVTGLQTALDGKADSSHGTHVSYSSTTPVMDGTASVGSASTVARSDHKHPTDTSRAAKADFDTHTGDTIKHITSTERTNWNAAKTHADAAHAPSNAEKNQNAFSNVKVGDTTVAADTTTDTLTLVAGNNVTITPDATNDKITIAATDTVYTHPTTSGNKHIPSGGSSGQILRWSADGTAVWGSDNNSDTKNTAGSTDSSSKLFLIGATSQAANPQTYSHDTAYVGTDGCLYSGGSKVLTAHPSITKNDDTTSTATATHGGTITMVDSITRDSNGHVTKVNTKTVTLPADNNTTYSAMTGATSSAAGKAGLVPAPAAGKQASFLRGDGTWVVPTNTTYSNMTAATSSAAGKAGLVPAPAAGAQAKFLRGDGTWQTPTNTTYSAATTSANGLMSSTDKTKLDATNIAYGTCSTDAATAAKVITISGNTNWKLAAGSMITVKFSVTNTAQNPTFNVNSTGAKSVWYNTALITTSNLGYAGTANRPMNFVYDGTQYVFVGWSYDANSTYSNAGLGQGYGTCSTAAATTAKVVTLSSYSLTTGGIVAVKFTNAVPASATMNINSKGAKSIYYRGAAIKAGVIEAGDIATFIYNGSQYHLLTIDKQNIKGEIISTTEPSGQGSGDYWLLDY